MCVRARHQPQSQVKCSKAWAGRHHYRSLPGFPKSLFILCGQASPEEKGVWVGRVLIEVSWSGHNLQSPSQETRDSNYAPINSNQMFTPLLLLHRQPRAAGSPLGSGTWDLGPGLVSSPKSHLLDQRITGFVLTQYCTPLPVPHFQCFLPGLFIFFISSPAFLILQIGLLTPANWSTVFLLTQTALGAWLVLKKKKSLCQFHWSAEVIAQQ